MPARLRTLIEAEHDRLVLFVPVTLGAGAMLYFRLMAEPPAWVAPFCLCASLAGAYMLRRFWLLTYGFIALSLLAAGVGLAQYRTLGIQPSVLQEPLAFARVSGKLETVEQTPKGSKLIVKDVVIEGIAPEKTPARISLTLRFYDATLTAGQRISLRAGLFPPPQPALPGGFDFARYYYFNEIGAVGYGIPPLIATPLADSGDTSFATRFAIWRHRITDGIRSHFSEPAGSVAAAFITGQTQTIPSSVNEDMRTAGLYHLLAVSGMNLSVVAGIAFFTVRLLLACIPAIALRYNIKKGAALVALLVSYAYLEIAGAPVSAQRAFLMVSLIFIAILLDRDPSPMRSVAASAFFILCVRPEAVLTASFQLSYSATAALIASYEWGVARLRTKPGGFSLWRIAFYFLAVIGTSLVAWLATEPFIIYHFNQFSSYSLLANTIAEPLVSFVLMPLVLAGLLLMPLGLGWLAFTPMQYGVDGLLALSRWIAGLPHALWIVPAPTDAGFAITVAGLIWLYFLKTGWRWAGVLACVAGMGSAFSYNPPDLLISADGRHIAARLDDGSAVMLKGRKDSFIASQWAHAMTEHALHDRKSAPLKCDANGCTLLLRGHLLALPRAASALSDDCATADIIIATDFSIAPETCHGPLLVDLSQLERNGSASITFREGEAQIAFARTYQGERAWTSRSALGE